MKDLFLDVEYIKKINDLGTYLKKYGLSDSELQRLKFEINNLIEKAIKE